VETSLLVSDTNLKINDTDSTQVIVEVGYGDSVEYKIGDSSVIDASWSQEWDGTKTTLNIYGAKSGSTTITITNTDTKEEKVIYVEVVHKPIAVSSITLSDTSLSINTDDTYSLTATITPSNADDKTITWTSSNENVATVRDGIVTGISAGSAIIAASAGDYSATCNVVVTKDIEVNVITTFPQEFKYYYVHYNSVYSKINITDLSVTYKKKSSGKYGLTISYSGIKAYDEDGSRGTTRCVVQYKVYDAGGNVVLSGTLSKSNLSVGDKFTNATEDIGLVDPGEYTLKITDYGI
jgi:hypothetical protein